MSIPEFDQIIEPTDQTEARREHLEKLRGLVGNVYPNKFERSNVTGREDTITNIVNFAPVAEILDEIKAHIATLEPGKRPDPAVKDALNEKLKALGTVRVSGRLAVPPRVMGKAAFVHLSDGVERLQIYVRKQDAVAIGHDTGQPIEGEDTAWEVFGLLDHGDFIGVSGYLFLTNTGELSVHIETLQFLSKAMLPMPDKMHGISDPELQRRYRYADLIASSLQIKSEPPASAGGHDLTTREVFERRAKLISGMRSFLDDHGYVEVETPMLTPKATGAAAKPFETHHNALDIPLYARIAPELYLKRLVVGGFEKVYELNRNFRNEGLSQRHNPEFTMLEFYCAYMDVNGMMDFAEEMIQQAVAKANNGSLIVKYGGNEIDFSKFEKLSMKKAIIRYFPCKSDKYQIDESWLDDLNKVLALEDFAILWGQANSPLISVINPDKKVTDDENFVEILPDEINKLEWIEKFEELADRRINNPNGNMELSESDKSQIINSLFEMIVESNLTQPTFIIDYPKSISPLSKASPKDPNIAERFELFINGMEVANGFSELNDPKEQYERFVDQMKQREGGDEEAMVLDEDYIRALSYGMPPAAGIGIGIDRLVMLLTDKHSIRDVILFPHMRPEKRVQENENSDN
jgi:lysyl-tRNA synthetase class 2